MIKKRIKIDTAAYNLLLSRQQPGESMSATIKRLIPKPPPRKRRSR
jgi:predicted CopG family antitoxin